MIVVHPGLCEELLGSANYEYSHTTYINLETRAVDFCQVEKPAKNGNPDPAACGNGILENSEECDDGNNRDGDGCSKDCKVVPGWRCYTNPMPTRCIFCIDVNYFSTMYKE